MLSRVADALFWMSRYVERAEHVARLLDACTYFELEFAGIPLETSDSHWHRLAWMLKLPFPDDFDPIARERMVRHLTYDSDHSNSIVACISKARGNARGVRGVVGTDVWREINGLYWRINERGFVEQFRATPHELYKAVSDGSQQFQGVCDASLFRDEGWYFVQLGKLLERADVILRVLAAQCQGSNGAGMSDSLQHLHWAAALRACQAYNAYQRLYVGRIEPHQVAELLLLDRRSPRSVRFALEFAAEALKAIEGGDASGTTTGGPLRLLRRTVADLEFFDAAELRDTARRRSVVEQLLTAVADIGKEVQERYSLR